jgi:hypothetical protein
MKKQCLFTRIFLALTSVIFVHYSVEAATVLEGEQLANRVSITSGAVSPQDMTIFGNQWSGNAQLFWANKDPSAHLKFIIRVPETRYYRIAFQVTQAPDFGDVQIFANGKRIGSYQGYSARVKVLQLTPLGADLRQGSNELLFTVSGKDPRSANYYVGLDKLEFEQATESTGTTRQPLGGGASFTDCTGGEQANLYDALGKLGDVFTSGFGKFVQCLDDAYLVEFNDKSAHEIASYFQNFKLTKIECSNLSSNVLGEAPVEIGGERLAIDHDFARTSSAIALAGVIAHELSHNYGFSHSANDFGTPYYGNTVPEQMEACVVNGVPNKWPGPGSSVINPSNIAGIGIDSDNNYVFTWYLDGTVTAGTSTKLHSRRIPTNYKLPKAPNGYQETPADIAAMGIDGDINSVYVWFKDYTVSSGSSTDLSLHRKPYTYKIPCGELPTNIVGIDIDSDTNLVFAWYKDGKVSAGSSDDLCSKRQPYQYFAANGKQIVEIAIDGDNNMVFAWYNDGTVSAGSTENLLIARPPEKFDTGR